MAEETFVDEQNYGTDESENAEEEYSYEEESDEVEDIAKVKQSYEEQLAAIKKENERLAKFEARYKANKKAEAGKTATEQTADIDSVVERKLQEISEKNQFKQTYGEDIFKDVAAIKEKHPTLTWEEAKNLSPVYNDPARTANPDMYSNPGRINKDVYSKSKYITSEQLSKLPQKEYNLVSDKVLKGEIIIKD